MEKEFQRGNVHNFSFSFSDHGNSFEVYLKWRGGGRVEVSGLFSVCTSIAGFNHSFLGMPILNTRESQRNETTLVWIYAEN